MYRVNLLSDIVLFKLYEKHISSDEELDLSLRDIADLFDEQLSINLIRSTIELSRKEFNEKDKLIKRKGNKGNYRYDLSLAGIEKVQNELRRSSSPIAYYSADQTRNLEVAAGIQSDFMTPGERAVSESWKPLPIDRESPAFIDMRSSVIDAIESIEHDNGLAVHFPAEREGILQTLKDGLEWVSVKAPTRAQIKAILISPLTWIITKFSEGLIVEACKKAAAKIFDWLMTLS
jgi:hypothetical protein